MISSVGLRKNMVGDTIVLDEFRGIYSSFSQIKKKELYMKMRAPHKLIPGSLQNQKLFFPLGKHGF